MICEWFWHNPALRAAFNQFCRELGWNGTQVSNAIAPFGGMRKYTGSYEDAVREVRAVQEWQQHGGGHPQLLRDDATA